MIKSQISSKDQFQPTSTTVQEFPGGFMPLESFFFLVSRFLCLKGKNGIQNVQKIPLRWNHRDDEVDESATSKALV